MPGHPVQFFILEAQTTYTDWVTFNLETRTLDLRCFDVESQLYLETKVGITEVTCSYANQIQLRLGKFSVSNTVRVTQVRMPKVENLVPNGVYSSS